MTVTGFVSDFNSHNKREPNKEEMIEMSKVLSDRTEELGKPYLGVNDKLHAT